jgi:hypothetical protein
MDNVNMDIGETKWSGMDWIHVAQNRDRWRTLVNAVMNLDLPSNAEKFLIGCTNCGLSRRA